MIHYRDSVTSTQDEMKEKIEAGEAHHLDAVCAAVQTGGRGRQGRAWVSGEGNLFASIFIAETRLPITWIPLWVGVALDDALQNLAIPMDDFHLKWPNDLIFKREYKAAGILCEKVDLGVIAGVGVNVQFHPDLPDRKSTSLQREFPDRVTAGFAKSLLVEMIRVLKQEPDFKSLQARYAERSLFAPGDHLSWVDPFLGAGGTPAGQGEFLGFGSHGEMRVLIQENGMPREKSLFGEEITGIKPIGRATRGV